MLCTKQKTITIKPVFSNSNEWRILYWTINYKGKVLHISPSIYSQYDQIKYFWDMRKYAVEVLQATHIKNWLTGSVEKASS